jgi:drug/metabolite transporter superfamily protein YnfA
LDRIVWVILAALCTLLGVFILYLTLDRPDRPMIGFQMTAALLAISGACVWRMTTVKRANIAPAPPPPPVVPPPAA